MDTATLVYTMMMFSVGGMVLISSSMIVVCLNELVRRWRVKIGYRSGYHPEHGHVQMFGFAIIRRFVTGMSGPMITVGVVCSLLLLLFFAPALNAMRQMTPEEFLKDFQEFQQERQSPVPTSQQPDPG